MLTNAHESTGSIHTGSLILARIVRASTGEVLTMPSLVANGTLAGVFRAQTLTLWKKKN